MFGSVILEVAAGLTLVIMVLSAACSAIREIIESWMKKRAVDLERTLREMLQDPSGSGLTSQLFDHPLINGLFPGRYDPEQLNQGKRRRMPWHSNLPSYIPGPLFSQALLDIFQRQAATSGADNSPLSQVLQAAATQTDGSVQAIRAYLESWYDAAMERTSGWYKRNTQIVLFLLGLTLSALLNVDALRIADALYRDGDLRQAVLLLSEKHSTVPASSAETTTALTELRSSGVPIGWTEEDLAAWKSLQICNLNLLSVARALLGWLITALAISQGAPFWFDLLNRITSLRSTLKPPSDTPPAPG